MNINKRKTNKGFTLIELAVFLAIIAVLAAILTPLVTSYIDQARTTRAVADVRAIAQAYALHIRDTGEFPIFANATAADTGTTAFQEYFTTDTSAEPALAGGISGWTNYTAVGTSGSVDKYLNTNILVLPTNNPGSGRVAFRGPYLDLSDTLDPWGNAYIVTALNLVDAALNAGFVMSAGPNGLINTADNQTGTLTAENDDIVSRIR